MLKQPYENVESLENRFLELYGEKTISQSKRYNDAFEYFKRYFNVNNAYVASSSGRVEVCGNHTDHNGGKVVSCAISLDALAMFLPTSDNIVVVKSEGYDPINVNINGDCIEKIGTSSALVRGVIEGFKDKGNKVGGFIAYVTSNVVGGVGISSSASFEVLISEILNFLYNDGKVSNQEKAVISQYAENKYFGKPCGLLDQTAIAFGGLNKLDFSVKGDIGVTKIENIPSDYTFVLINSGGSHADLTDEYASIPREMFNVAKAYGKDRLIEISENDFFSELNKHANELTDREILRATHFYEENNRVDNLYNALLLNDTATFLEMVKFSGISSLCKLQNCYVSGSCFQPIPKALSIAGRYLKGGVNRVHGGGFAGSILNVVKNTDLDDFISNIKKFYNDTDVVPLKIRSVGTIVL